MTVPCRSPFYNAGNRCRSKELLDVCAIAEDTLPGIVFGTEKVRRMKQAVIYGGNIGRGFITAARREIVFEEMKKITRGCLDLWYR